MENLVNYNLFNNTYQGKKVLVTGHTGFKGSWLVLWLQTMGAEVTGYSLDPPTEPNHFELLNLDINHIIGDILDEKELMNVFNEVKPEIVFHLAAQSLVRLSYEDPVKTYKTNVIGTLNVFEACRKTPSVKVILNITSDKCYANKEWLWGYKESDPMGGFDPYSSSKGCSELLTDSYKNSYFNLEKSGRYNVLLASVRAGNVIGGGDWAKDRLIPDIMHAISQNERVEIRSPHAIRPWQHVLEPLSGYLLLASRLILGESEFAASWNFGPAYEDAMPVKDVLKQVKLYWDKLEYEIISNQHQPHEATYLKLDCSKANTLLKWKPVWDNQKTFEITTNWYKKYYLENDVNSISNLVAYIDDAIKNQYIWTK
ncbi:MAG: CDP-glucose 4,6-dehydratase [Bacteroidales bacterium]|nr:CDP-glucose 4,6-dehydratase [Bacteroidales bacterium]